MKPTSKDEHSLSEVHESVNTAARAAGWRRIFAFLGPAYLVSVGYMDPGNWATDIAGGSQFGYKLVWVLLMSNLMALLLQGLSARLGIVRGRDLAQANREAYPKPVNFMLYILAEIAIAATDLAEVLGMAIGIQLLTGLPLIWGVSITILDTFLLLYLQRLGIRKMEAFIITLVAIIALCFFIQIFMAKPAPAEVLSGFIPTLPNSDALYIAIGIIGATVMPHNLYLHSALVQTRKIEKTPQGIRKAIHYNRIDTTIALNIAFLVNASILVLAATVFYKTGNSHVAEIKEAHRLLPGFLGETAPVLFALALIAAGQSSTITGTLAGQIVMEGYLRLRINPILRRLITRLIAVIPAFFVILIAGEEKVDTLLVFSQVILSLQLGFAIIPLIYFVSDKKTMGQFAIRPSIQILAWLMAAVLIFLNLNMLANEMKPIFADEALAPKIWVITAVLLFGALLLYILLFPHIKNNIKKQSIFMHEKSSNIDIEHPIYNRIAVTLDFSGNEEKILSHALAQGHAHTHYYLLHVVESAGAGLHGKDSNDYETRKDRETLDHYVQLLQEKGFEATGLLGFRNRTQEIERLTKSCDAQLLIMGAHGHRGIKDFIFGSTVNAVRHRLDIPVLVVKT